MKPLDRFLQHWRILKAGPYIPNGSRVLDIGCADGILYRRYQSRIASYVGIDPILTSSVVSDNYRLIAGKYPEDLPELEPFNVIIMLAFIEHLPSELQKQVAEAIFHQLEPKGTLVITTPSPRVDLVLKILKDTRIIDGMSLEDHYHFDIYQVPQIFEKLELVEHKRFQLGLNHLFIFQKM